MSAIVAAWNRFFFAEQSPLPLALFRLAYGLVVACPLVLLKPDWLTWYGTHAWVSLNTTRELEPGVRLNLFTVIPQDDRWILALFWVFLASAIMLTVGFLSRINSVIVYLCLASIQQRNLYITHGGDTFLRVAGFFLIFAPAGAALSVDRLLRVWRGREQVAVQARRLWAQRMIQIELSLVYVITVCWKLKGGPWIDGSALFYVNHLFDDKNSDRARRSVNLLTVLDIFHRLSFVESPRTASAAERQNNNRELLIATASRPWHGRDAMKLLARSIPLLWPLLPLCYVWNAVQSRK